MPITPTGSLGKCLAGACHLIASSAAFQTATGSSTAAAALRSVHLVEADESREGESPRPRAIVTPISHDRARTTEGQGYAAAYGLLVSFENVLAAADNSWDSAIRFLNWVETVLSECQALSGTGTGYFAGQTHVVLDRVQLVNGPSQFHEHAASGEETGYAPYQGITYEWQLSGL